MSNTNSDQTVLVTGGTGFVAIHCILQLLQQNYKVRTTIRSLGRKNEVIEMLQEAGITSFGNLSFEETDLMKDNNWDKALRGCDYVLHVASPISLRPKTEKEMVRPAVDGTLRVLKAAKNEGVKRVIMTSNFGAVGYSHTDKTTLITEKSWTDPDEKRLSAYNKSKVLAERAAWNFINQNGGNPELAVINPVGIFGPSYGPRLSSGFGLLKKMLNGSMKAIPNMTISIVDVRDLADLHIRAMKSAKASGERFLALSGGVLTLPEIAALLKANLGDKAKNVSTRQLADWKVRIAALFSPVARNIVPQLGRYRDASNAKARNVLGWNPRSNEEALLASAESLFKHNNL